MNDFDFFAQQRIMNGSSTPQEEIIEEDCRPCLCPHCHTDLDDHDGSGFCPGGTEEFGGRR